MEKKPVYIEKSGKNMVMISAEEYEKLVSAYEREDEIIKNISMRILRQNLEAYKVLAK